MKFSCHCQFSVKGPKDESFNKFLISNSVSNKTEVALLYYRKVLLVVAAIRKPDIHHGFVLGNLKLKL